MNLDKFSQCNFQDKQTTCWDAEQKQLSKKIKNKTTSLFLVTAVGENVWVFCTWLQKSISSTNKCVKSELPRQWLGSRTRHIKWVTLIHKSHVRQGLVLDYINGRAVALIVLRFSNVSSKNPPKKKQPRYCVLTQDSHRTTRWQHQKVELSFLKEAAFIPMSSQNNKK